MRGAARLQAAIELLDEIISAAREGGAAADNIARKFFAQRRYAGSKDRRAIRDLTWDAIRKFGECPANARAAFAAIADEDDTLAELFDGSQYGPAALDSAEPRSKAGAIPEWIEPLLHPLIEVGEHKALLQRAPLDIRVNRSRMNRETALAELAEGEILPACEYGLRLPGGFPVARHPLYLNGSIDIQDMGSQLIVDLCSAKPGQLVIDLCAGAGGKTLALAEAMDGSGKILAADITRARLDRLMPRAERASVSDIIEARLLNPGQEVAALGDSAAAADLVLVDAPCSGSGTWRRNPETRWRLTPDSLTKLTVTQASLLDLAATLVKPGGALVYAVCSLLHREGEAQIEAFLARHSGWSAAAPNMAVGRSCGAGQLLSPAHDGSDGFFFARLEKSC